VTATKFSHSRFARQHPHLLVVGLCSISAAVFVGISLWFILDYLGTPGASDRGLVTAAVWAGLAIFCEVCSIFYGRHELHRTAKLFDSATEAKAQTDELFRMTDMLQSAEGYDDATAVLMATSLRLVPEFGAALYIFNNSRDRLDLAGSWNMPEDYRAAESLAPSNCWTLKRGKPHANNPDVAGLCCAHHAGRAPALEIPMMARSSVYGLLVLVSHDPVLGEARLKETLRIGQPLVDSMSLALSNISLREKLRTQSLRDPLTGLYNRRYMEDALERFLSLSERNGTPTSVLMIDLDHFKQLNDEHGHAKGDAVLRDVATQLVAGVRPSDVVCRYGGEELMIILPECGIEDARIKAEALRLRIEGLSEVHNASVTASIGISGVPETSTSQSDLVAMADSALYLAKRAGRNCIMIAERRAGGSEERRPAEDVDVQDSGMEEEQRPRLQALG
jgi:diguanylate cyclase (GGDEF)-like protein